mmetsp:Transcript_6975/g.22027  ORF Transcript_6975/g.22027 Transcript_6975/m.22027 type:complete len:277 (-) Transcript_6975:23-853(-)
MTRRGLFVAVVAAAAQGARAFATPAISARPHASAARASSVALCAKAKKGKPKKKQPKKSGMAWAKDFEVMPFDSVSLRALATEACGAFEGRTGKPVHASLSGAGDLPKALYNAPCAVVVSSPGDDGSTIAYANAAACEAYNQTHSELIGSATDLAATVSGGYDSKYGKKIPSGVTMRDAKRWEIAKMAIVDGELTTTSSGAGYAFESWTLDDGRVGRPGGVVEDAPMDPGELEALIEAQGAMIRELKEEQGLGNKSPEVLDAVAELLRLKAMAEEG